MELQQGKLLGQRFDLYLPSHGERSGTCGLAVVLHGFQGDKCHYAALAKALSNIGWAVFVPNLQPLLGFSRASLDNLREMAIATVHEQVQAVLQQLQNKNALSATTKVALVGHSAGGAVAVEVALRMRSVVGGLLLLDAVPWKRTREAVHDHGDMFERLEMVASIRAPPSAMNAWGAVHHLLVGTHREKLMQAMVIGAKHGDFAPSIEGNRCKRFLYRKLGITTNDDTIELCTSLSVAFLESYRKGDPSLFEASCSNVGMRVWFERGPSSAESAPDLSKLPSFLQ